MSLANHPGYAAAARAVEANTSSRAKRLADLERYVEGKQYDGLPDWFSDSKPLWERAPCVVDPIVQSAIDSNTDLLLGEGRFPLASSEDIEGDEGEAVEAALARIIKQARLRMVAREAFGAGQGCGSAVAIFGVRAGRLFIDTVKARWCETELTTEGAVKKLEIRYGYVTEVTVANQRRVQALLYRRVIDEQNDITYQPAAARPDGIEPTWVEATNIKHGLGFCPVVWYPHMRGCAIVGDIDGNAIHDNLTDEIRAHDFALSQKHRAALFAGDPQWTEVGVEPGYNPTSTVRTAEVPTTLHGGKKSDDNPVTGGFYGKASRNKARKKSPGTVWQYPKGTIVELHTLPGDALDSLEKDAKSLRILLCQSMAVVFLDHENLPKGTSISGRALESLKARQLDRCDSYRVDFGDRFLLPALGMLIRIALAKKLIIKDIEALQALITKLGDRWSWHEPPLSLAWGRYIRLDAEDEAKLVELSVKARDGGIVTTRTAVEKVRGVFDIKDIDKAVRELDEEKQQGILAQQKMAAQLMADDGVDDEPNDDEQIDDESFDRTKDGDPGGKGARAA